MNRSVQAMPAAHDLLSGYTARPDRYDELCQRVGGVPVVRPHWRRVHEALAHTPAAAVARRRAELQRLIHENGITYNVYADPRGYERPWELDLLPFVLPAGEWRTIEAAVRQRATLFNRILADLYGEQRLLEEGCIPPALIYGHSGFLRPLVGAPQPGDVFLHLYAVDLARSPDGRWWVVADRTQAPSGAGYALENRSVVARVLPELYRELRVEPLVPFFERFRDGLIALAPAAEERAGEGGREHPEGPLIVLLTPGPYNETYFEHAFLARELGFPLVEGQDLTVRDGKVFMRTLDGLRQVQVILRRVDDVWCDPLELRDDSALGVAGLVSAVRAGTVTVANALGSGLLETGALLGYLPGLAERLLGERLKMPSVATWWCGEPAALKYALEHLRELVVKPAYPGVSGKPVFCRDLSDEALAELAERIRARPFDHVAQEMVNISQAPVLATEAADGGPMPGLLARNMSLRVFVAATPEGFVVLPGGLVRMASEADMRVVSMQHGGGSKDAWVLAGAGATATTAAGRRIVPGRVSPRMRAPERPGLSSRVAESFFWLGRYSERADSAARLGRESLMRVGGLSMDEGQQVAAGALDPSAATLNALLGLCQRIGILTREEGCRQAGALAAALFDGARSGSVVCNLRLVLRLATQLRDRLSPDSWRVYNRLGEVGGPLDDALALGDALHRLDETLLSLVTLSGFVIESMPRDTGWRFLSIGRRIERLQFLAAAIGALLPVGQAGALQALLAVTDDEVRYRSLFATGLVPGLVAELVIFEVDNPRALHYQLSSLAEHVSSLPGGAELAQPMKTALTLLAGLATCGGLSRMPEARSVEGRHDCVQLQNTLHTIWLSGNQLADALSLRYFTHLDARSQATASR
ncbi:MAG: circularly permuted type 2 ATP-grasp protein [Rhodocyclaceae bacterium]|jgi:uncharacterized circularly permuted ATP-grasp superfamily protein/uncharacterized alpha-E superfamily protein|nr:circularly permuted type 2 ATP-grasp protein [Rhodocyclaceae bacterium]